MGADQEKKLVKLSRRQAMQIAAGGAASLYAPKLAFGQSSVVPNDFRFLVDAEFYDRARAEIKNTDGYGELKRSLFNLIDGNFVRAVNGELNDATRSSMTRLKNTLAGRDSIADRRPESVDRAIPPAETLLNLQRTLLSTGEEAGARLKSVLADADLRRVNPPGVSPTDTMEAASAELRRARNRLLQQNQPMTLSPDAVRESGWTLSETVNSLYCAEETGSYPARRAFSDDIVLKATYAYVGRTGDFKLPNNKVNFDSGDVRHYDTDKDNLPHAKINLLNAGHVPSFYSSVHTFAEVDGWAALFAQFFADFMGALVGDPLGAIAPAIGAVAPVPGGTVAASVAARGLTWALEELLDDALKKAGNKTHDYIEGWMVEQGITSKLVFEPWYTTVVTQFLPLGRLVMGKPEDISVWVMRHGNVRKTVIPWEREGGVPMPRPGPGFMKAGFEKDPRPDLRLRPLLRNKDGKPQSGQYAYEATILVHRSS